MRYRSKGDFIANDPEGKRILVAQGDKVYVQQFDSTWEVFSFYSRKSIGTFDETALNEHFGPESEFQKPPRDGRFRDRNFGKSFTVIFILLLPLMGMSQVNPVVWDWKAVRVDPNHFEFQLRAYIAKGWWIYAPNKQDDCPYSPIVTFDRSSVMKPIERMTVLEYILYANNESIEPPFCPVPQYRNSVVFMQLFRMPMDSSGIVKGQITFQPMSRYIAGPPMTVDFDLHIGAEPVEGHKTTGRMLTTYPKGIFRKTWWFIRHPFGPYYIKKSFYP